MRFFFFILCSTLLGIESLAQAPEGYDLVWVDNFDGHQLDKKKWKYRSLGPRRDAFNVKRCVTQQKGLLALRVEEKNDSIFSVMLSTQNSFETTYGYFEVRCLLPNEIGLWPAFWLQTPIMGTNIGNPAVAGAEIDIFEYFTNRPNQIHHTLHYDGYEEDHKVVHKVIKNKKFKKGNWHTFGLKWTSSSYTYYIDGEATFTTDKGISKRDQYIILSMEVGEQGGEIKTDNLPEYFIIDYVKVFKLAE